MAANSAKQDGGGEVKFDVEPPKGDEWRDESKVDIDGWYTPEVGKAFKGRLVDRIQIGDDSRDVVLVRLASPFKAGVKGGGTVMLSEGQILGVGIRSGLRELLSYVEHRGACWVGCTGKRNLEGKKTLWTFKLVCNGQKSTPPAPSRIAAPGDNMDDIPF